MSLVWWVTIGGYCWIALWFARRVYAEMVTDVSDKVDRTLGAMFALIFSLFWPLIAAGWWLAYTTKAGQHDREPDPD